LFRLDKVDDVRSYGHGSNGLFVHSVAYVENFVALASPDFEFVMHFGHEGAHRIDHHSRSLSSVVNYRWR
jgi:hypothetical protein